MAPPRFIDLEQATDSVLMASRLIAIVRRQASVSGWLGSLRIKIPELDVDSKVVPVGINPDQSMEIPSNIANIGWYEPGPSPGDPFGSAVLAGHRDGAEAGRGAFYNLGELDRGDVITLATKTKKMKFSVLETEILDKRTFALRSREIFASDGPGVLTLITCGGDYDRGRGGYQANVIVTAKMSG